MSAKLREGRLKFGENDFNLRPYVYVPSSWLQTPNVNIGDIFKIVGVSIPNIILRVPEMCCVDRWNCVLPPHRKYLDGALSNPDLAPSVDHYRGVVEENCKRLFNKTASACKQAGSVFRVSNKWNPDVPTDYSGKWLTNKQKVTILCYGQESDYHPAVWAQLLAECKSDFDDNANENNSDFRCCTIDEQPFRTGLIPCNRETGTFPHPALTHLIITDNLPLLEDKINNIIPWGLILINGDESSFSLFSQAIHDSLPVIVFRYTGFSADIAANFMDHAVEFHTNRKTNRKEVPELPFPEEMPDGYRHPLWLGPFSNNTKQDCRLANILIENFPDRFNETSVFVLDMFKHSEEDLQDYLTQTLAVAFEGSGASGELSADNKRLTYAWKLRYKLLHNAHRFQWQSDVLMFWFTFFTLCATWTAVLYTFMILRGDSLNSHITTERKDMILEILLKSNLLLPLVAALFRSVFSILNPENKFNILRDAAAKIESEIYLYRSKVGKYNPRRAQIAASAEGEDPSTNADEHPRMVFCNTIDAIVTTATDGDMRTSALRAPPQNANVMDEINGRLYANIGEQQTFLAPMASYEGSGISGWVGKCLRSICPPREEIESRYFERNRKERRQAVVENSVNPGGIGGGLLFWKSKTSDSTGIEARSASPQSSLATESNMIISRNANNDKTVMKSDFEKPNMTLLEYCYCCVCMYYTCCVPNVSDEESIPDTAGNVKYDDGLVKLSADEYVRIRLLPLMGEIASATPGLAERIMRINIFVAILSIASSALSTFGYSYFVPAVLALSGAIVSWTSYQQVEQKLLQKNIALQRIRQMLVWWDGLTMIEKRVPVNKDTLIRTTENCILSQSTTIGGSTADADENADTGEEGTSA